MKKTVLFIMIALNSFTSFSQCSPDITTGLIAKWNFGGNAADSSGNGHNGTVHNAQLTTDRCGNPNSAYSFFGTNQYIDVPDAPSLRLNNIDYTISAWVNKWDTIINNAYSIIAKRVANNQTGYHFYINGGTATAGCPSVYMLFSGGGASDPGCIVDSVIVLDSWQHIVVTYTLSTSTVRFYIDDVLRGMTDSMPTPNGNVSPTLRIGNDTWVLGPYGFNGKIDDIKIYNRVLDSCDIDSLHRTLCAVTPPQPCSTTGINENNANGFLKIYPNPSNGNFIVKLSDYSLENANLTVTNLIGEKVQEQELKFPTNEIKLRQPSGIYFLTVSNKGRSYTTKIILQ